MCTNDGTGAVKSIFDARRERYFETLVAVDDETVCEREPGFCDAMCDGVQGVQTCFIPEEVLHVPVQSASITAGTENAWDETTASHNASMSFHAVHAGVERNRLRLSSRGDISLSETVTVGGLDGKASLSGDVHVLAEATGIVETCAASNVLACAGITVGGDPTTCDAVPGCTYSAPVPQVPEACVSVDDTVCSGFTPGDAQSCTSIGGLSACIYTPPAAFVPEACSGTPQIDAQSCAGVDISSSSELVSRAACESVHVCTDPSGGGRWAPAAQVAAADESACTLTGNSWDTTTSACTDAGGSAVVATTEAACTSTGYDWAAVECTYTAEGPRTPATVQIQSCTQCSPDQAMMSVMHADCVSALTAVNCSAMQETCLGVNVTVAPGQVACGCVSADDPCLASGACVLETACDLASCRWTDPLDDDGSFEACQIEPAAVANRLGVTSAAAQAMLEHAEPCRDCRGVLNGPRVIDPCGECWDPADPQYAASCTDCNGVLHGSFTRDACGVCLAPDSPL